MSELEHDLAERRIREAIAQGAFDDLPGAGKPLDLRGAGDPDWWIRRKLEDEGLDAAAIAPGALGYENMGRSLGRFTTWIENHIGVAKKWPRLTDDERWWMTATNAENWRGVRSPR